PKSTTGFSPDLFKRGAARRDFERLTAKLANPPQRGDEVDGVKMGVRAPEHAVCGDRVAMSLEFDVGEAAHLDAQNLSPHDVKKSAVLELVRSDGKTVAVRPYDPDSGMPDPPDPNAKPRRAEATSVRAEFPL